MTMLLEREGSKMLCPVCDSEMLKLEFSAKHSPIRFCSRCEIELVDDRFEPPVAEEEDSPGVEISLPWDPSNIETL